VKITQEQIDNWFEYHAPENVAKQANVDTEIILADFAEIRVQGKILAETIVAACPECADVTYAIRLIRMAIMTANAGIACGGK